ncbi:MAG: [Fe-Fe] hydrogenase large subunit C-terminal domain-containing protein [Bacteroidales bacterium]|nr:[Fe-Fe] hydrogenase large subunit C-terminal domain-containing protein [Bacteroidales bacterium]
MQAPLVFIEEDKCKVCYACVRVCPVKAIELRPSGDIPYIQPDKCIGCGSCLEVCSPRAIKYYDSKPAVNSLLKSEFKVVALIDPGISAEFDDITDYRKFVRMLHEMGFDYVHDVAFGVDLVAKEYNELVSNFLGKYYILTNCPPIVSLVEKYFPQLIDNLAPIVNPMIANTKVLRELYGPEIKVVFIGPCIGAKEEADRFEGNSKVDEVLTFAELREMFDQNGIKESTIEFSEFDEPRGYKGYLYPISTGIIQAAGLNQDLLSGTVVTADGKDRILAAINQFEQGIDYIQKHFNMFYCEGCMMGPGMKPGGKKYNRQTLTRVYAAKRLKDFNMAKWNHDLKQFQNLDFKREFKANNQRMPDPPEEKVEEVLKIIEKNENAENLGCKACGYETCRDFAIDVANGITRPDMCIMHSLKSKQEYIRSLKHSNDKLAKTQQALQNSEKRALAEKQLAQEALETSQTMLHKLPTAVVIVDDNMKIIGSNESFVTILGEEAAEINEIIPGLLGADLKTLLPVQFYKLFAYVISSNDDVIGRDVHLNDKLLNVTIFSIKKNKIVGAVIRDMYMPEVRKEEVINRVTEVIEQNLDLVQQIAFLLGEGAAKTEKMLNSIIESHKSKE